MRTKVDIDLLIISIVTFGIVSCAFSFATGIVPALVIAMLATAYVVFEQYRRDKARGRRQQPSPPIPSTQQVPLPIVVHGAGAGIVREYIEPPAEVRQRANLAMQAANYVPLAGRVRLFDLGLMGVQSAQGDFVIRPYAVTNYQPLAHLRFQILDKRGLPLLTWASDYRPTHYRSFLMPRSDVKLAVADLADGVVLNVAYQNQYHQDLYVAYVDVASCELTPADILARVDYLQDIRTRLHEDGEIDKWATHAAKHMPPIDMSLNDLLREAGNGATEQGRTLPHKRKHAAAHQ